ncbi:MAG TPA: sulfite oxidase [Herpetosiphonaceae bacterium]
MTALDFPPETDESLALHQADPLNGGPDLAALREAFVTPASRLFARNHGPVPRVDPAAFRLEIGGLVARELRLSLDELRRLPFVRQQATLQCAGNRRQELTAIAPIPGELPWGANAIGNGVWGGVPLSALLALAGVDPAAEHLAFEGLDEIERDDRRFAFGGSIPLATLAAAEVLLAYELNGAPLPARNGGPLRAVVPGVVGARSVKWLGRITVRDAPSDNYFQTRAYRLLSAADQRAGRDWAEAPMLHELWVNAAMCAPQRGELVAAGPLAVRGYAIAGLGAALLAVEVALDGGQWRPAAITEHGGPGVWSFWETEIELAPGPHALAVRATDSAGNVQPAAPFWNVKGYLNNGWHRIEIEALQGV